MEQHTVTQNYYAQPDIWLSGVRISDPTVALTGLLMAIVSFYCYFQLRKQTGGTPFQKMMRWFFLCMTAASIIGAIVGHAFLYHFSIGWKFPGWVFSMLASAALAQAAIYHWIEISGERNYRKLTTLNIAETLFSILLVYKTVNFHFVELHSAFSLLILVGTIEFLIWRKTKSQRSQYFLLGIFWAIVAVLPHVGKFSLHTWFTYFDLGHLILCLSFWAFFRAAHVEISENQ